MIDINFLADFDSRQPGDALVGAVQSCDKLLLVIVRNVKLKTQAKSVGFQRALPNAFDACDSITRSFRSRTYGLTMKGKRKSHIALLPRAFNPSVVCREFPFKLRPVGSNAEANVGV